MVLPYSGALHGGLEDVEQPYLKMGSCIGVPHAVSSSLVAGVGWLVLRDLGGCLAACLSFG
ncbi:hypothetical protein U1Q18_045120, partial [Sarracenia purpurea var. burkii]